MATSDSYLRLLEVAGRPPTRITTPTELAHYLTLHGVKVSEQMMTNWKARGVSRDKSIDVAAILNTTVDYILYGKESAASPAPALQLARDPILEDLAALEADEAAIWQSRIDETQATLKRLHNEIRAAANKPRRQQEKSDRAMVDKAIDDPPLGKRRTA